MFSYKAYLMRWLAQTTKIAPFTSDRIMKLIQTSGAAAALQCCGGPNGRMCGLSWAKKGTWDGTMGVGQQMGALEAIQSNLIKQSKAPVTNSTGGTSKGNALAGEGGGGGPTNTEPVTLGGKVGAGFLTLLMVVSVVGLFSWMNFEGSGWQYTPLTDS